MSVRRSGGDSVNWGRTNLCGQRNRSRSPSRGRRAWGGRSQSRVCVELTEQPKGLGSRNGQLHRSRSRSRTEPQERTGGGSPPWLEGTTSTGKAASSVSSPPWADALSPKPSAEKKRLPRPVSTSRMLLEQGVAGSVGRKGPLETLGLLSRSHAEASGSNSGAEAQRAVATARPLVDAWPSRCPSPTRQPGPDDIDALLASVSSLVSTSIAGLQESGQTKDGSLPQRDPVPTMPESGPAPLLPLPLPILPLVPKAAMPKPQAESSLKVSMASSAEKYVATSPGVPFQVRPQIQKQPESLDSFLNGSQPLSSVASSAPDTREPTLQHQTISVPHNLYLAQKDVRVKIAPSRASIRVDQTPDSDSDGDGLGLKPSMVACRAGQKVDSDPQQGGSPEAPNHQSVKIRSVATASTLAMSKAPEVLGANASPLPASNRSGKVEGKTYQSLQFAGRRLGDHGLGRLLRGEGEKLAGDWSNLPRALSGNVDLSGNLLTDTGVASLVDFLLLRELPVRRLTLSDNRLAEPDSLCKLLVEKQVAARQLRELRLVNSGVNEIGFLALFEGLSTLRKDVGARLRPPFRLFLRNDEAPTDLEDYVIGFQEQDLLVCVNRDSGSSRVAPAGDADVHIFLVD